MMLAKFKPKTPAISRGSLRQRGFLVVEFWHCDRLRKSPVFTIQQSGSPTHIWECVKYLIKVGFVAFWRITSYGQSSFVLHFDGLPTPYFCHLPYGSVVVAINSLKRGLHYYWIVWIGFDAVHSPIRSEVWRNYCTALAMIRLIQSIQRLV